MKLPAFGDTVSSPSLTSCGLRIVVYCMYIMYPCTCICTSCTTCTYI